MATLTTLPKRVEPFGRSHFTTVDPDSATHLDGAAQDQRGQGLYHPHPRVPANQHETARRGRRPERSFARPIAPASRWTSRQMKPPVRHQAQPVKPR